MNTQRKVSSIIAIFMALIVLFCLSFCKKTTTTVQISKMYWERSILIKKPVPVTDSGVDQWEYQHKIRASGTDNKPYWPEVKDLPDGFRKGLPDEFDEIYKVVFIDLNSELQWKTYPRFYSSDEFTSMENGQKFPATIDNKGIMTVKFKQ